MKKTPAVPPPPTRPPPKKKVSSLLLTAAKLAEKSPLCIFLGSTLPSSLHSSLLSSLTKLQVGSQAVILCKGGHADLNVPHQNCF